MIRTSMNKERSFDEGFSILLKDVNYCCNQNDDDFLLLCVGETGTGKSHLAQWAIDAYMGDKASILYFGLDKRGFARAQYLASRADKPRMLVNDEANVSKRESLSKYNQDMINYYNKCRHANIFHWWNNPSLQLIDKHFLDDRIKGIILIYTKSKVKPRMYYYIKRKALSNYLEKHKDFKLSLDNLKRVAPKIAFYQGWFKKYNGKLLSSYMKLKNKETDNVSEEFYQKYYKKEEDSLSMQDVCKALGISRDTVLRYETELTISGVLKQGQDYMTTPTGRKLYAKDCLIKFEQLGRMKREAQAKALHDGKKKAQEMRTNART